MNITTLLNSTCDQCLCVALQTDTAAINCFLGNNTCQFFDDFPQSYRLQPMPAARLYFPQGVLPSPSDSCMPNLTQLIDQLSNASVKSVNVSSPRCLVIDNHGYLVTVEDGGIWIHRFDPFNLTRIDSTSFPGSFMTNIAYFREAYYVGLTSNAILIVDSNNLSTINIITELLINGPRDMTFLQDGQTLVLASTFQNALLFFNCTNYATRSYTFAYSISTGFSTPHGLLYMNDSFFYTTSWGENTIYSYSKNGSVSWTRTLFADIRPVLNGSGGGGSHVVLDESGRGWFSLYQFGIAILDPQGNFLYNYKIVTNGLFDVIFTDNYVMYVSEIVAGRILRLDPNILC